MLNEIGAVNSTVFEPWLTSESLLVEGEDLECARLAVSDVFVNHGLDSKSPRPLRDLKLFYEKFDALSLCYFDYGRDVIIQPDMLSHFYLVMIPLSGEMRIHCGSREYRSSQGMPMVLPAEQEIHMHWSEDTTSILVQIDRRKLTDKLENYLTQKLTRSPRFDMAPQKCFTPDCANFLALQGLMQLAKISPSSGRDAIAKGFEDAFIFSMLNSYDNDMRSIISDGAASRACPKSVRRTEEYIAAHLADAITIEDLVKASGGSARSLFDSFKRFRDMPPMRFVKFQRMHKVREVLQNPCSDTQVSEIALNYGFTHLGRFACEYAKQFGESPSQTLRAARLRVA